MAEGIHRGVLLKGIPFSTTKDDIKSFFKNITIHDDQITVIFFRNNQSTGLAFVQLSSGEVERALLNDRNHMGNRYVEVIASDDSELYELLLAARVGEVDARELNRLAGKRSRQAEWRDRSPIRKELSTKCAYIAGVPKGCTYRHVREFFKGCLIGRNCIHLLKQDGTGSFRGDGYVEFGNEQVCIRGLRRNGEKMRDSLMKVVPCSKEEMYEVAESVNGAEIEKEVDLRDTLRSRRVHIQDSAGGRRTPSPVRKRMKQYAAKYGRQEHEDFEEHFGEPPHGMPFEDEHMLPRPHHRDYPPARPSRRDYGDSYMPERREMAYREPPRKEPPPVYPPHYREHGYGDPHRQEGPPPRPRHEGPPHRESAHRPRHDGPLHRPRQEDPPHRPRQEDPPHRPRQEDPPHRPEQRTEYRGLPPMHGDMGNGNQPSPPQQGHDRRIVRLEGLAYETSVRHILEFFHEYRMEHEHVRIQCRDDGSPSGKAFVVFPSEKNAREAVAHHDKHYILGRFVELFLL